MYMYCHESKYNNHLIMHSYLKIWISSNDERNNVSVIVGQLFFVKNLVKT